MSTPNENYLPPGWTEEMYERPLDFKNAWATTTDEQFARLQARRAGILPSPLPEPEPQRAACVEAIEEARLNEWGFSVFRADYSDDQAWSMFVEKFLTMLEAQLTPENGTGIDAVRANMRINWIDNEERLQTGGPHSVRAYARELATIPGSAATLELPAILLADAEVISTLCAYDVEKARTEVSRTRYHPGIPWVWAIDTAFEPEDDRSQNDAHAEEYDGTLKVAIGTLINGFFPVVATEILGINELFPDSGNGGIWFAI